MNILLGIIIGILLTFISIIVGIFFSNTETLNKILTKARQKTMPKGIIIPAENPEEELLKLAKDKKVNL